MTEVRLIDANALEKTIIDEYYTQENPSVFLTKRGEEIFNSAIDVARCRVRDAPTIDAVPVVNARWVDNHCTACGMMPMGDELWEHLDGTPPRMEFFMSYCPCCGAKMDGTHEAFGKVVATSD